MLISFPLISSLPLSSLSPFRISSFFLFGFVTMLGLSLFYQSFGFSNLISIYSFLLGVDNAGSFFAGAVCVNRRIPVLFSSDDFD